MSLSRDDVQKIAHLARIAIDDSTEQKLLPQLQSILAMVDQMAAADTAAIEPMAHPFDVSQPLRADEVTAENRREELQAIAPAVENGLFLVPKVIE